MALLTVTTLKSVLGVGNLYADSDLQQVIDTSIGIISSYITAEALAAEPAAVKEATLTLAVDLWSNRVAPGGQMQAVDFTPSPYRMGRTVVQKVIGALAPYLDNEGVIG